MNLLLETAIKISLVIGLGLLAASLLRRQSAALRHWMLASAIAVALGTPLLMGVAPSWTLPVTAPATDGQSQEPQPTTGRVSRIGITTTIQNQSETTVPAEGGIALAIMLLTMWMAGVVVNLAGLLVGFWRLHRTAARATIVREGPWADTADELRERLNVRTPVRLLQSDRPAVLVTWGVFSPKVLLPIDAPSWDADRIRVVLAHELAHVQRRDWVVQIGSEMLRIVCWFNPLVWLAASRLRLESERACDDAVVSLGVSGRDYALHLLELARQFGRARDIYPAVAIVPRPSSLERRVTAMLNPRLSRRPMSVTTRFGTIAALLAIALPIALFAQNTFVTISGTIVDESGAVLPGVEVSATDLDRPTKRQVVTDGTGRFEIIGVPQGNHTLQAKLPGFETFDQRLTVSGEDVHRHITLSIGSLQETISVTSGPTSAPSPARGPYKPRPANCGPAGVRESSPPPRAGAVRVGGQIRQPAKLYHVPPVYPEGSPAGVVMMEAVIGADGYVTETKILRNPSAALAQSAIDAVRQWVFEPTLLNCVAVPVRMTVTVQFG